MTINKKTIINLRIELLDIILKIVFDLLLLVLLGELGYYLYSFYGDKISNEKKSIVTIPTLTSIPTSTTNKDNFSNKSTLARISNLINENAVTTSYFISEIKGKVIALQNKDINNPIKTYPAYHPELKIGLETNNNGKKIRFSSILIKKNFRFY